MFSVCLLLVTKSNYFIIVKYKTRLYLRISCSVGVLSDSENGSLDNISVLLEIDDKFGEKHPADVSDV